MATKTKTQIEAEKSYLKASRELLDALTKFQMHRDYLERVTGEVRDPGEHLRKRLKSAM